MWEIFDYEMEKAIEGGHYNIHITFLFNFPHHEISGVHLPTATVWSGEISARLP